MEYQLRRPGQRDLVFEGEIIAHQSSQHARPRWTEITLYRTDTGRYVVEVLGKTTVRGERERSLVTVCDDLPCVLSALTARTEKAPARLTDLALDALAEAGEVDPLFKEADTERI